MPQGGEPELEFAVMHERQTYKLRVYERRQNMRVRGWAPTGDPDFTTRDRANAAREVLLRQVLALGAATVNPAPGSLGSSLTEAGLEELAGEEEA